MRLGGSLERRRRRGARQGGGPREGSERGRGDPWDLGGRIWLVGAGVIVFGWLLGYVVATRLVFPSPPATGDLYEVPDLAGLDVPTAREQVEGAGLVLEGADSIAHPTVPRARILGQSPLPGQLARPEASVRVTVSLGPERRTVPDVRGLLAERARILLESSGFVVVTDSTEAEEPRGRVVELAPPSGQEVSLPAEVRLVVSTGPAMIPMPMVLGMPREDAVAVLDSLGLVVSEVREVFRFGRDQGVVVEQEPAADTELTRGSEVRISVGRGGVGREQ